MIIQSQTGIRRPSGPKGIRQSSPVPAMKRNLAVRAVDPNAKRISQRQAMGNKPKAAASSNKKKGSGQPTVADYLAMDPDYLRTINNLNTNLGAYNVQNQANQRNLRTDYLETKRRLGIQQGKDQTSEKADFAARGLFGSGLQAKDYNDLAMQYSDQFNDADTSYARNLGQLKSDAADAARLKNQNAAEARAEAIRRRASQYGITGHSVPKQTSAKGTTTKKTSKTATKQKSKSNLAIRQVKPAPPSRGVRQPSKATTGLKGPKIR